MIHTLQRNDEIPTNLFDSVGPTEKNAVIQGDCIDVMRAMPAASVDLILTDPPYLVNYRSRDGRTLSNDDNDRWLDPAFAEAFRVLRPNRVCVSFYGWSRADRFLAAWRAAGFGRSGISSSSNRTRPRCGSCATSTSRRTSWRRGIRPYS